MNSALPFVLSIIGILLASTSMDTVMVWRLCSLLTFVIIVIIAPSSARVSPRFTPEEFKASGARRSVFYAAGVLGMAVTLLQLYNFIRLQTFWPFFAAIATFLVLDMLQFVLLVFAGQQSNA